MLVSEYIAEHIRIKCVYRSGVRAGDHETVCPNFADYVYDPVGMPICGQCAAFINGVERRAGRLVNPFTIHLERWTGTLNTGIQLLSGKIVGPSYVLEDIAMEMHGEIHGYEYNGV